MEHTTENLEKLASFKKATSGMVAINDRTYGISRGDRYWANYWSGRKYTPEEIQKIIEDGSIGEQIQLSRSFFARDGYYRRIISYYATLLQYSGLLMPKAAPGKSITDSSLLKRYNRASVLVDKLNLRTWCANCIEKVLVDGAVFGVVVDLGRDEIGFVDLPISYARCRLQDARGNRLIEFNLAYFDTLAENDGTREAALEAYPKDIVKAYRQYRRGKLPQWYLVPLEISYGFMLFDQRPFFLSIIPRSVEYDGALEQYQERVAEEVRKIIVQKIPHLTDGRLVFEPDEAEEMHNGTVGMLRGNKNLSVLTTYGDVEAITSQTQKENVGDTLTRIEQNIYSAAGVTSELFAADRNSALSTSLNNDLALAMHLANQISLFISNQLNQLFGNGSISFKYMLLPISYYNQKEYVETSFKLVGSGYCFLLPAAALGFSQEDLTNIKDLENEVLKLQDKLRPLATAYTQTDNTQSAAPGATEKAAEDRSDKTIKNIDAGGASS